MILEDLKKRLKAEIAAGLLFESEGTILSSAEGYNHAACAVIGAMLINLGKPTFNIYCENQRRMLGWLVSRNNPIARKARDLRSACHRGDPSISSMFEDVRREFLNPIFSAHRQRRGQSATAAQEEAVSAMLIAKILWDLSLGNSELVVWIRMLGASV